MKAPFILSLFPLVMAVVLPVRDSPAPVLRADVPDSNLIPGQYIVKMKSGTLTGVIQEVLNLLQVNALFQWVGGDFQGFAAKLSDTALTTIRNHPAVDFVEQDAMAKINAYTIQSNPSWGLGRISHKKLNTSTYVYDKSGGSGTCAYVIDTGIQVTHQDFGGRAKWLVNYAGDGSDSDGNGHGTHVAGTIGGATYGVAKQVNLYAVKVLNATGSGPYSGIISGINYVAKDLKTRGCPKGTVVNLSLGGSKSTAVNSAAAALVSAGAFVAVAAGNDGVDAGNSSPASEPTVCTVGATTISDTIASYSNFGPSVDILAPGTNILSTWIGSTNQANKVLSGTSMATPHIAGLGAYLLTLLGSKTPAALCTYIQTISTRNAISNIPAKTVNYLAFNNNTSV